MAGLAVPCSILCLSHTPGFRTSRPYYRHQSPVQDTSTATNPRSRLAYYHQYIYHDRPVSGGNSTIGVACGIEGFSALQSHNPMPGIPPKDRTYNERWVNGINKQSDATTGGSCDAHTKTTHKKGTVSNSRTCLADAICVLPDEGKAHCSLPPA